MNLFQKCFIKCLEIGGNFIETFFMQPYLYESSKGLTIIKNQQYINGNKTKKTCLDFYFLKDAKKKPILFFVHGGGFIEGRKETKKYYCYHFARAGYFVVNINYHYGHKYPFPSHIKEILKAVEYTIDKKDIYNLDLENIVLAGDSAGAYFVSYIPVLEQMPSLYETLDIDFKYNQKLNIKALVTISGLYDLKETLRTKFPFYKLMYSVFTGRETKSIQSALVSRERDIYSIYDKMKSTYPPTFIITGTKDPLKACSFSFNKVLNNKNIKNEFFLCKTGLSVLHSGAVHVKRGDGQEALKRTLKFLQKVGC